MIIYDDDSPSLSIYDVTTGAENGTATFTATLSAASGETVTVDYASSNGSATAGADYTAASGSLSFAPGETTKSFSVPILDDGTDEANETATLTLSNASNATISDATGSLTITDDDLPNNAPTVQSASFVATNGGRIKAGPDLVIADARLMHGAWPNQTDRRRTLVLAWHSVFPFPRPPSWWADEIPDVVAEADPAAVYEGTRTPGAFLE